MRNTGKADDFAGKISDALDLFEVLQLAAEAPFIIDRARAAAAIGATDLFYSAEQFYNPGQLSLVHQYCIPYAEMYWATTENPDPDTYLTGMYMQHYAIEQALSDTCEMSYEAGRAEAIHSVFIDLSQYMSEAIINRALDATVGKKMADLSNDIDWKFMRLANAVDEAMLARKHAMLRRAEELNDEPPILKFDADQYDKSAWKQIGKKRESMGRGEYLRWLSEEQQFRELPWWFQEQRRMYLHASMEVMDWDEFVTRRGDLHRAVVRSGPSSGLSGPPPGYTPYKPPSWWSNTGPGKGPDSYGY